MNQRGRQSAASLEVVGNGLVTVERPQAPSALTREQSQKWVEIVERFPADWFAQSMDTLAQYCRHVVDAQRVGQLIENLVANGDFDVDDYDKLLKMQEREGRALSSLATRMRITQQSTVHAEKKKSVARLSLD